MEVSNEERKILNEFKKRVGSKTPPHMNSDYDLLRWLKARDWDVDQAEEMLFKSLEWRKEWGVDNISEWNPPEVLKKYYPMGHSGYDKEGAPVWILRYGKCDIRGILSCCSKQEVLKYLIYLFEQSLQIMREQSVKLNVPIGKQSLILDLDSFTLRHVAWKPALDLWLALTPMLDANYPEVLKYIYVINAPLVYTMAFSIVKPFVHEITIKKIRVFGGSGWKEALLEEIDSNQIPVQYGGTMVDPDGNPECPSKVNCGGEVPKSYYFKKKTETSSHENLQSVSIPKNNKKEFKLQIDLPGTELRWVFQSEENEIGFGVSRYTTLGKEEEILPLQKVNSHLLREEGSIICNNPGFYKVTFQNDCVSNPSSEIFYRLDIRPPTEHTKL